MYVEIEVSAGHGPIVKYASLKNILAGDGAFPKEMAGFEDIHCHHKVPKGKGGNDAYQNLAIVHISVHKLIHATKEDTIRKYLAELSLDNKALQKLNKLRTEAGYEKVPA